VLIIFIIKLAKKRAQGKFFFKLYAFILLTSTLVPGKKLCISQTTTSNRRLIKLVKRRKVLTERYTNPLLCEIDIHADTTCFGRNFRATSYTSEVCSAPPPYLSEYESVTDIPICSAATAVELVSGETIILDFGQGLWFGDRLNHLLINPNQRRSYGILTCDDPTDRHRDIRMELDDRYFLPFKMRGTTCYFQSRSPDDDELESCRTFQVSDANHWDPTDKMFISVVGRGQNVMCLPVCASGVLAPIDFITILTGYKEARCR